MLSEGVALAEIIGVSKEKLGARFGYSIPSRQVAYVREDLPRCVRAFVTEHELYHLRDGARWWVWREIKANGSGALKYPLGFLACALMSLRPYRLKYYVERITGQAI